MAVTRQYHCNKCKKDFEERESITIDPQKIHKDCGGELKQVYGTDKDNLLFFTHPMRGAISRRFG